MKLSEEIMSLRIRYDHACPGIINGLEKFARKAANLEKALDAKRVHDKEHEIRSDCKSEG